MNLKKVLLSFFTPLLLTACPGSQGRRVDPILSLTPPQGRQTVFEKENPENESQKSKSNSKLKYLAAKKITNPFFYVLKRSSTKIYVLGTMHRGIDYNELPSYILDLLKTSDVSIHEVNALKITSEQVDPYVELKGEKLSSLVSSKSFENILKVFSEKYSRETIENMHPWYIGGRYVKACSSESAKGPLDLQLEKIAQDAEVKSVQLETFEYQVGGKKNWNDLFEISCDVLGAAIQNLDRLYRAGNLKILMGDAYRTNLEEDDQNRMSQRNRNWLPIILENTRDVNRAFIYVGAAHLHGEHSILKLLAQEGFSVERCGDQFCPDKSDESKSK